MLNTFTTNLIENNANQISFTAYDAGWGTYVDFYKGERVVARIVAGKHDPNHQCFDYENRWIATDSDVIKAACRLAFERTVNTPDWAANWSAERAWKTRNTLPNAFEVERGRRSEWWLD